MLDNAPGLELGSRLACQAVPDGSSSVTVEIPNWNRNHAQEATH
jgi:2Fe-2S ferredoxin